MIPLRPAPAGAALAVLLLAACSGEPSEPEIQAAFDRRGEQQAQALKSMLGTQLGTVAGKLFGEPQVRNVRKIGCKADGEQAYRCDLEFEVQAMGQDTKQVAAMRFVKASEGWVLTD